MFHSLSAGICGKHADRQLCPSWAPRAVQLDCHLPLLYKWRVCSWLWLTTCFVATEQRRAEQSNLKKHGLFSRHVSWEERSLLIRFYGPLSYHRSSIKPSCRGGVALECQTLQLNNQQIGSGHLSHSDAHYQISALWLRSRLKRWEEDERTAPDEALVWYGEEQMLALLPGCLCSEEPVSNLHNEKRFSALLHTANRCTCSSELQISLHKSLPLLLK